MPTVPTTLRVLLGGLRHGREVQRRIVFHDVGVSESWVRLRDGCVEGERVLAWSEVTAVRVFGRNLDDRDAGRSRWGFQVSGRAPAPLVISDAFCRLDEALAHFARLPGFCVAAVEAASQVSTSSEGPGYAWVRAASGG